MTRMSYRGPMMSFRRRRWQRASIVVLCATYYRPWMAVMECRVPLAPRRGADSNLPRRFGGAVMVDNVAAALCAGTSGQPLDSAGLRRYGTFPLRTALRWTVQRRGREHHGS